MMSRDAKSLLKAARRHGEVPDQAAKARMRSKILSTVAVAAAASAAAPTTAAAATASGIKGKAAIGFAASRVTTLGLVKAGAVGALIVGGSTWVATRQPPHSAPMTQVTLPSPTVDLTANVPPVPVLPSSANEGRKESPEITRNVEASATAQPHHNGPVQQPSAGAQPASVGLSQDPPAVVTEDSLSRERALLAEARVALAAGDTNGAMRSLGAHASQYPSGVLANERRALMAMAYCGQGRIGDGLAMFPLPNDGSDTPLSAKVRAACR
jgi:hypothetical protein